jgi:hypothetical protein
MKKTKCARFWPIRQEKYCRLGQTGAAKGYLKAIRPSQQALPL